MTYAEAVARLLALRGGEKAGMRPGLERIQALLDAVGNPERRLRLVQVGGTNGKGSVAAMLAAILTAAGHRVGLYTSPHLCSLRERIRVDGRCIAEDALADGVEALGTLFARFDASVFEATTALALDHFAARACDVAVLEVGLGGRLDATTVGRPGGLGAHARRLRPPGPARRHARPDRLGEGPHHPERGGGVGAAGRGGGSASSWRARPRWACRCSWRGATCRSRCARAASTASGSTSRGPGWRIEAARCALLGDLPAEQRPPRRRGGAGPGGGRGGGPPRARAARWPGRFQVLPGPPPLILDGAHNPGGARALADSLRAYFPDRRIGFVLGMSADKDLAGILAPLLPLAARVVFTASPNPRAADPADAPRSRRAISAGCPRTAC